MPVPWRPVLIVAALILIGGGLFLYASVPPPTTYQQATQQAVANVTANPSSPLTNPTQAPTQNPPQNPPPSGSGGISGSSGTIRTNDILGGNPGPFDLGIVLAGGVILMGLAFTFFRGRWTTMKVLALVALLVGGSVAILAADSYASSALASYSTGTGNATIPIQGTVYYSGTVGGSGGSASVAGQQAIASVVYHTLPVAALSLRVDVVLGCANCSLNITSGWATILLSRPGSTPIPVRNTTYRPLAFAPGRSVNLYNQSFNATQLEAAMGYAACNANVTWTVSVQGTFSLTVSAAGKAMTRTIAFGWSGLQLTQEQITCLPSRPGGAPYALSILYPYTPFRSAYVRG